MIVSRTAIITGYHLKHQTNISQKQVVDIKKKHSRAYSAAAPGTRLLTGPGNGSKRVRRARNLPHSPQPSPGSNIVANISFPNGSRDLFCPPLHPHISTDSWLYTKSTEQLVFVSVHRDLGLSVSLLFIKIF